MNNYTTKIPMIPNMHTKYVQKRTKKSDNNLYKGYMYNRNCGHIHTRNMSISIF